MEEGLEFRDIVARNRDLEKRLESVSVGVTYDSEFDIFLVTLGESQEAITEEVPDGHGLQLRLDPSSLKIVGFEILGFKQQYLKAHPEFAPHFHGLFEESPLERRDIPHTGPQRKRAEQAVRKLVPA